MPTLRELVDDAIGKLTGFTTDLPMRGTLQTDMASGDTQFTVQLPMSEQQPLGLVEIDSEVMLVESFDVATGRATVPAWGRAQLGTLPAPHDAGAMVTVSPRYPRGLLVREINRAVQSVCPPLFGVQQIPEFRVDWRTYLFGLPARSHRVLRLEFRAGTVGDWLPVSTYEVRADTNELWLPDKYARAYVRGLAAVTPQEFVAESEDYETVTGLENSTVDIVHNAVVANVAMAGDLARQSTGTVESSARNRDINSGSGAAIARFHLALNEQRLAAEVARLNNLYPPRMIRKA